MASPSQFVQLAKSLPQPLQRFFARWPPAAIVPAGTAPTVYQEERPNPFRFYKNKATGKWQDPVYSARRQAELVKLARDHGVEELLPETTKATDYRLAHRVEHGLRVKGTGVGQKVKGRIHERHMISKYDSLELPTRGGMRNGTIFANRFCLQDGTTKKGHVGYAQAYQGLEDGKFTSIFLLCHGDMFVGKSNWTKFPK
ncbi:54S ribosomal protein L25, mitochondrial [Lecanicillium sp. MT-2017a]|nr:54S ribosomal protein L25, mitochondrial [Lecanicillium sp. MT-2017a]